MTERELRDVIVIGAGFAGIAALHYAKQADLDVVLLEAGSGVGGTWYWNTYPDVRTDTEAWYYSYSFAPEVTRKWRWRQRFPSGSEVRGFLEYISEELNLTSSMRFNSRVVELRWDDSTSTWTIQLSDGTSVRSKFVITAVGGLSAPNVPKIPGIENFKGSLVVSSRWAADPPRLEGKRVGVIGTGSTGVQLITALAPVVDQLYVLQRTPNFVLPRNNYTITDEHWAGIVSTYDDIWSRVRRHYFGYPLTLTGRSATEASPEEREDLFELMWQKGGFSIFLEAFDDLAVSQESNQFAADFIRRKIRSAVADPATADLLAPSNHPFGGKRPVIGSGYYETFNRENVHLIDLRRAPIEVDTGGRIHAGGEVIDLDVLILATGFDAGTGAISAIDVFGTEGHALRDAWKDGTRTHYGTSTAGFPNLLYVYGPQTPYANQPPCVERSAEWAVDLITFTRANNWSSVEGSAAGEDTWSAALLDAATATIFTETADEVRPWFMSNNVEGKRAEVGVYFGGYDRYFDILDEIRDADFDGMVFR